MSYSNYQLNQKINNLQNQIDNLDVAVDLQTVLNEGNSAVGSIELVDATNDYALFLDPVAIDMTAPLGYSRLEASKLIFGKDTSISELEYTNSTDTLDITTTNINLNGQVTFDTPPHSVTPILGDDLTTKGYVDSLVGQYSGGYNLYLNYSETLVVNSITYNYLSNQVSSATQQDLLITTDGTDQLLATFISGELNLSVIPAGLWSMVLYGAVSGAGGVLYYYFKIKRYNEGTITDIITSGFSPDVNATPTGNPDAYHMNATIDTPIYISLTDRIIIEIYCKKISGVDVQLNTYFESSYYSFIQTSLNTGTTLLTSDNNWTGNNNFAIIPTTITATAGSNNTQITTTAYIYNALLNYLTSTTASATYLSITDALTTYLSIATASITYLTISNASAIYLSITDAISTYAPIASPTFTGVLNCASFIASTSVQANSFRNTNDTFTVGAAGKIAGTELTLGTGDIVSCGDITSSKEIEGGSFKNTDNSFSVSSVGAINCLSSSSTGTTTANILTSNTIDSAGTSTSGGNVTVVGTPTSRNITIAGGQTSGTLSIGNGARSASNNGTVNFCNNTNSKNSIYFGNGALDAATQTKTYIQGGCTFSNIPISVTPLTSDSSTAVATTAYVQTNLSSYLTTASASSLYATIANLSNYLTSALASTTYLSISTASATYATIVDLGSYLTTAIASATYAPLSNPTIVNNLTLGSGNFDVLSGTMRSSGNISSTSGAIIAGTIQNTLNNASISSAGVIKGTSITTPSLTTATGDGLSLGTTTATAISIGASGITTTINGPLTASEGLTLGSSKFITTSHTGTMTIPSALQVGYIQNVGYSGITSPTTGQIITMRTITLAPGVWIITGAVSILNTQLVTAGFISFGNALISTSRAILNPGDGTYGVTSFVGITLDDRVTPNLTVYVSPTASTSYYFNLSMTYTGTPGYNSNYFKLYAIRIA